MQCTTMSARPESGGYAFALLSFFAILLVGAFLLILLDQPIDMLHSAAMSSEYSNATSEQGLTWVLQYWAALPFVFTILAMYRLISASALFSRP